VKKRFHFLGQKLDLSLGWWAVLLSVPALVPLMRSGFFDSPDGLMHAYRLPALGQAIGSGVLYPRWFPEFAFGYGHPLFNFFGPLTYYWGLPFVLLGANATTALKLVLATGLIASALGMLLFARRHFGRGAALVAAVVYAYLPYHLVDLYVRGAAAEFMAFVWFPLILWAFGETVEQSGQKGMVKAALAGLLLAALIVTHQLSALVFFPVLVGYIALLWLAKRDRPALGRAGLAAGWAAILSAFYWLPVLAESRYVGLSTMRSQGYADHLLPVGHLFSPTLTYRYVSEPGAPSTYPIGLVQAIILVAAAIALVCCWRRLRWSRSDQTVRPQAWAILLFLAVAVSTIYMLSDASLPVWRAGEAVLAYLEFPWRIQSMTILATAFLAGAVWDTQPWVALHAHSARPGFFASQPRVPWWGSPSALHVRMTGWLLAAALVWFLIWTLWRLPVTPVTPGLAVEDMWQMDRDIGQMGTTWDGEFIPVWVAEQRWAVSLPASSTGRPSLTTVQPVGGQLRLTGTGYARYDFSLDAPQGATVVLHQFHFPGWQARWNGTVVPSRPEGNLGLVAFDLSPGSGPLTIGLDLTPAQLWGSLLSLAGLVVGGLGLAAYALTRERRPAWGPLLLAAGYLLPAALLLGHLVLPSGAVHSVEQAYANLENRTELLGFTTDRAVYAPGDTAAVTLYWRPLQVPEQDYKVFVHLTGPKPASPQPQLLTASLGGLPVAQHDGDPGGGFTPTTRWLPGELVPDTHRLILPADLPPGRYGLWAGIYEYPAVRNLEVISAGGQVVDGRIFLGEIEVRAR